MRKSLIAAAAATAMISAGTTAYAQAGPDGATLTVTVAPKKAGTKSKQPVNSSVHFVVTNNDSKTHAEEDRDHDAEDARSLGQGPQALQQGAARVLGRPVGLPEGLQRRQAASPRRSSASNTPNPTPLTFDVKAFVVAKDKIDFSLHARELPSLSSSRPARSAKTSKGPKLTITVPLQAQQPAPGVYAGLSQLDTTLKARRARTS